MHNLLILANGSQTRFGPKDIPKQLVDIYGVPLLTDTVRKFQDKVDKVLVLTGNTVIHGHLEGFCIDIGPTEGLRATMLASRILWGDERTTYLFGDCFYTPEAVETIANCNLSYAHVCRTHNSRFTGKAYGESFAMMWDFSQNEKVAEVLALKPDGTSWEFYRKMAGIDDLPEVTNYLELSPECLIRVDDFTDDFDTWNDYLRWKEMKSLYTIFEEIRQSVIRRYA